MSAGAVAIPPFATIHPDERPLAARTVATRASPPMIAARATSTMNGRFGMSGQTGAHKTPGGVLVARDDRTNVLEQVARAGQTRSRRSVGALEPRYPHGVWWAPARETTRAARGGRRRTPRSSHSNTSSRSASSIRRTDTSDGVKAHGTGRTLHPLEPILLAKPRGLVDMKSRRCGVETNGRHVIEQRATPRRAGECRSPRADEQDRRAPSRSMRTLRPNRSVATLPITLPASSSATRQPSD